MKSTKPTPDSIAARAMIRDKSATKTGFTRADVKGLNIHISLISNRCALMMRAGVLFRGNVKGQPLHYFSTAEAAKAWEAAQPVYVKKRKKIGTPTSDHKQTDKSRMLVEVILRNAATPRGFTASDRPDCVRRTSVWQRCAGMTANGELFVTTVERGVSFYFTTQAGADACRIEFMARVEAKKVTIAQKRKANAKKVMAAKVAAIPRRTYVPPVKREIEIIYPEGYKHSVSLMPEPRNQAISHSFVHSGMRAM